MTAITLSCNIFGFSFYTPAQFHPQTLNTQKDFKNTGKCEYLNYRMICFKILLKSSSKRLRKLQRKCSFFMFQVSPPSKWLRQNVLCGRKKFIKSRRRKMWRRQTFFVTIKAARNYKTKNIYIIFVIFFC